MAFTAGVRWEGTGVRVAVIRQNVGGAVKLPNSSPIRNHDSDAGWEFSGGGLSSSTSESEPEALADYNRTTLVLHPSLILG